MADAEKTKRSRKKQEVTEAQREQQKKNRARSTGSRGGYTPTTAEEEFADRVLQQDSGPLKDLDVAAAAAKVIMPNAPEAPLATDGEQYSLFGELTPEEKLQAHVEVLSKALEEEAYAIAYDPRADEFDALYADQLESLKTAYSNISAGLKKLRSFLKSPEFQQLAKSFADFAEWVRGTNPQRTISDFLFLGTVIDAYRPILPYFLEEIERLKQEPGLENLTLTAFMRNTDENGNVIVSLFERAAQAAAERAEEAAATEEEAAAIEKGKELLPMLQAFTAGSHVMPNNPLMNNLQQKDAINAGAFDMVVSNASKTRKEITAYTMITYDPGEPSEALTATRLTEYERQVSDAIVSLWIEAEKNDLPPVFSPDMIFRAMPGGGDKPSPQQKGAIAKAIEKFRGLHIYVDATEEMKKRKVIGETGKYVFDEKYLNIRRHTYRVNRGGKIVQGYELLGQPVILTYSKLTNQLLTVPAKYIAIKKVKQGRPTTELVTMTADRQAMTGYLLRRIAVIQYDYEKAKENKRKYDAKRRRDASLEEKPLAAFRKQSSVILFDTLFAETGTATTDRKQTMLNRNFCFEVLDYWKATGYIRDYKPQQKGRSITGIEILL